MRLRHWTLVCGCIGLVLSGCVSEKTFQSVLQQYEKERGANEQLRKELDLLKAEIVRIGEESSKFTSEKESLTQKLTDGEAKIAELTARLETQTKEFETLSKKKGVIIKKPDMSWAGGVSDALKAAFREEMKKGEVQVKQAADRLVVMMAEPLLFDVDDVEIAPDAEEILMRLGNVLKGTKNQQIMVGGHLDDTPIAAAMAKEFPTAWEFTGARAVSVVRFLEEEAPLSGRLLTAAAYGSSRPITSNTTDQGREQNRRLEVAILAPGG